MVRGMTMDRSDQPGSSRDPQQNRLEPDGMRPDGMRPDGLSGVYDPATLAAIDAAAARAVQARGEGQVGRVGSSRRQKPAGRGGIGAASLAGSLWLGALTGVGEALGDEDTQPHVAWFVPATADPETQAVSVHLVPGMPAASRVVVRSWLLAAG
jgi:hypothetical protein